MHFLLNIQAKGLKLEYFNFHSASWKRLKKSTRVFSVAIYGKSPRDARSKIKAFISQCVYSRIRSLKKKDEFNAQRTKAVEAVRTGMTSYCDTLIDFKMFRQEENVEKYTIG